MPFLAARGQASKGYFGGGSAPDVPTIGTATRGNAQISVAFIPPTFDGGAVISTYEYALSSDSYATWTARATGTTASPLVITGLANGTTYSVKLRAVNFLGSSLATSASNPAKPATIPGPPLNPLISSGSQNITVTWDAALDNGEPVSYTVETQKNSEAWVSRGAQTSGCVFSSLVNGETYRARITSINAVGSCVTPAVTGDTVPSAVPAAPTFLSASSGNGTYYVSWSAPANNGAAITSYTVQLTTANQTEWDATKIVTGVTAGDYTFSGLSNGYSYRAKVLAINVRGPGPNNDPYPSGVETPSTTPDSPTVTSSSAGDKSYTINWSAPVSNGGAAYLYTVQITDADQYNWSTEVPNLAAGTTSYTFNSLTNGKSYRARVKAVNVRGSSGYPESTEQTPTFAAPILSANGDYAERTDAGTRRVTWSVNPTDIVGSTATAGTTTYIYKQFTNSADGTAVDYAEELIATYTGNQTDGSYATTFSNSGSVLKKEKYRVRAVQSDGIHSVGTGWVDVTIIDQQPYQAPSYTGITATASDVSIYTTGNFNVNGGSYFKVSGSVLPGSAGNSHNAGDVQYQITLFRITVTSSLSASTTTRYFKALYAGANAANSGNDTMPTVVSTSSASYNWTGAGGTSMSYDWTVADAGFDAVGLCQIAIDGYPAATTSWSPTITVVANARGNRRTWGTITPPVTYF